MSSSKPIALVTGSHGLVGSTVTIALVQDGFQVIGIDNNMRKHFFGPEASVAEVADQLAQELAGYYVPVYGDIRKETTWEALERLTGDGVDLVVHCASQPSHDWAGMNRYTALVDFDINARGTLLLLEWIREHCPEATVVYMSTNKVYGDHINEYEFHEAALRYYPAARHLKEGVDEDFPIDKSMHSLFGVSKTAGDLLVQEYGRYFDMRTVCLRCGCITGEAHRGVKLHGFLAYLVKCYREGIPYTIIGYGGRQVRDNLHAVDLASAVLAIYRSDREPHGEVFNMGGGAANSVSILEAIFHLGRIGERMMEYYLEGQPRKGDHIWWISNTRKFRQWYPEWSVSISLEEIFQELLDIGG